MNEFFLVLSWISMPFFLWSVLSIVSYFDTVSKWSFYIENGMVQINLHTTTKFLFFSGLVAFSYLITYYFIWE